MSATLMSPQPVDEDADAFLASVFADYVERKAALWQYALIRPRTTLRALQALRRLPVLPVELPTGGEAEAIRRVLLQYPGSRRAMLGVAAVLRTPERPGTFCEGPARGTLRRKMRSAVKQGVTVRTVPPEQRTSMLELANEHERANEREQYRVARPDNDALLDYDLWLGAYDAEQRPVMLAVIPTGRSSGVSAP